MSKNGRGRTIQSSLQSSGGTVLGIRLLQHQMNLDLLDKLWLKVFKIQVDHGFINAFRLGLVLGIVIITTLSFFPGESEITLSLVSFIYGQAQQFGARVCR